VAFFANLFSRFGTFVIVQPASRIAASWTAKQYVFLSDVCAHAFLCPASCFSDLPITRFPYLPILLRASVVGFCDLWLLRVSITEVTVKNQKQAENGIETRYCVV
jgi:hypothetical protein